MSKPDCPDPKCGCFLGDLTNELGNGEFITDFVSLGAKTYAYKTNQGNAVVKVKGFTLDGKTRKELNFEKFLNLLTDQNEIRVKYDEQLRRKKKELQIEQVAMTKTLRVTYDKRWLLDRIEWKTLPWGTKF